MIPLATTTVTVKRVTEPEPGETRTVSTLKTGVPAHIGSPQGSRTREPGGGKQVLDLQLWCEPVTGMDDTCLVVDEQTAETYELDWLHTRRGLGLDHVVAGVKQVRGAAP